MMSSSNPGHVLCGSVSGASCRILPCCALPFHPRACCALLRQVEKIKQLRAMCDKIGANPWIEVDGGVTPANAYMVIEAGANAIVSGSGVFGAKDYAEGEESEGEESEGRVLPWASFPERKMLWSCNSLPFSIARSFYSIPLKLHCPRANLTSCTSVTGCLFLPHEC